MRSKDIGGLRGDQCCAVLYKNENGNYTEQLRRVKSARLKYLRGAGGGARV